MPWKLIGLVVLLVVVAVFATLNLSNRTDISLGVHVFREVPIFLSLLVAFLAGILVTVPFNIGRSRRKRVRKSPRAGLPDGGGADLPVPGSELGTAASEPQPELDVEGQSAKAAPRRPARGKAKSAGSGKSTGS